MKTLLIAAILVTSHGKQIKLTDSQVQYLSTHATANVKQTIKQSKDIRNNDTADQIFKFLGR